MFKINGLRCLESVCRRPDRRSTIGEVEALECFSHSYTCAHCVCRVKGESTVACLEASIGVVCLALGEVEA